MTGLYTVDLKRFNTVMSAIAYAVYFNDYGKPYNGRWEIFSPSMISRRSLAEGVPDPWKEVRDLVRRLPVIEVSTSQPSVFRCQVHAADESKAIYVLTFYGGYVVVAVGFPDTAV
jgi:hypothetical protein